MKNKTALKGGTYHKQHKSCCKCVERRCDDLLGRTEW